MVRNKGARYASLVAAGVLAFGALAACGDDERRRRRAAATAATAARPTGKVGVILPDTTTSPRWEANDRPSLQAAFDEAGVESNIENAGGDVAKFGEICDSMINEGVTRPDDRQPGLRVRRGVPAEGHGRRHPEHRLRPPHPGRRRVVLRVVRQRRGRRPDGRGPHRLPRRRPARPRPTSSTSTATRPTTTPRCSSRATRRRSPPKIDSGDYTLVGDQTG